MFKRLIRTFSLILVLGLVSPTKADYEQCKAVLDWIYRELTLNNLEKSYERAMDKMLLGLYTVNKNTESKNKYKPQMAQIFNSLKSIDPKLETFISKNKSINRNFLWWRLPENHLKIETLQSVFKEWHTLQTKEPVLFKGLSDKYLIDNWDLFTIDILSNLSKYNFTNKNLKKNLEQLGEELKSSSSDILKGKDFKLKSLLDSINSTQFELVRALNDDYSDILYDYRNVCSKEEMNIVLSQENTVCPLPSSNQAIQDLGLKLNELQKTIAKTDLLNNNEITINLTENPLVPIHILDYKVSSHPKVTFCKREPELMNMIVIHHTQTKSKATPHDINRMHLNKSTDNDPWYMVGYNYLISESFQGASPSTPKVFQGRPPEYQGAHAGGKKFKLNKDEKEFFKGKTITCGGKTEFILDKARQESGLKGNFRSYGVAIIGNYTPVSFEEIAGVATPTNLLAGKQQIPSQATIDAIAKLSCDIQNKNKRVKTIVPHSYFKSTDCPGNLLDILVQVKEKANELGCTFTIETKRRDGKWN